MTIHKMYSAHRLFWPLMFSLILIEYCLFRSFALREITPFYPTGVDQAAYLSQSYFLFEKMLKEGLTLQFKQHLIGIASTYTFILQAIIFFKIFGASRLAALTLNFIYFALLQLMVVNVTQKLTQRYLFAFLAFGLVLSLKTSYYFVGGLFDFRMDFMAFCLYGIFVCAILKSNVFLNLKWTIITVFIATYLILLRYITATYVFGILFLLLGFFIFCYYQKPNERDAIKIRLKQLGFSIIAILLFITPFLWSEGALIYNYYVGGHFLTNEKYIRASQVGVTNLMTNLAYYPSSLLQDHLGLRLLKMMAFILIGSYLISLWNRPKKPTFNLTSASVVTFTLIASILTPLIILTIDLSKSPIVVGIISLPIVLLIVWLTYLNYQANPTNKLLLGFLILATLLTVGYGIKNFGEFMLHKNKASYYQDLTEISRMHDDIGNYMVANKQKTIAYSSDQVRDFIIPPVLSTLYYEKHGIFLQAVASEILSNSMNAISVINAEKSHKLSNVFVFNIRPYEISVTSYPLDIALHAMKPHLLKVAAKELTLLGDYFFYGSTFKVYVHLTPA